MAAFPLQIYCSALLFAPSQSRVRQLFLHEIPPWISHVPEGRSDWCGQEVTIETGRQDASELSSKNVRSILAFSPDGQFIASCSLLSGVSF